MKKNMKKFLAAFCALILFVSGIGLDMLFGTKQANEVQAADAYTYMSFDNFGITAETTYESTGWDYQIPSYTAGEGNLNKVEFNGVVNFSSQYGTMADGSVGSTSLILGEQNAEDKGLSICTVPSQKWSDGSGFIMVKMDSTVVAYITDNIAGFALYDNEIELNMKIDLATPTADTTGVTLVLTLTDVDAPDKTYTAEITGTAATAYLAREMGVMYHRGAKITIKPVAQDNGYEKMSFNSFGITEETVHESTGWDYQIPSYTAGEGNLNKVEFNGVVNFSSQYGTMADGSVGSTALILGEKEAEDKGIGIYTVPSQKWSDGSGFIMVKMDSTVVAYIPETTAGFALYDNEIELNMKIDLAAPTAETTGVTLVLTMTDVDAPDKTYTAEITGTAATANLAREMGVMYHRGAKITLNVQPKGDDSEVEQPQGLLVDVATHDGVPFIIDQIADGQFYLHPGVCGETEVFENVPDYLKGLYFVQNANIIGLRGVVKSDGYVYILASDNLLEELKAEGFSQVACYGEGELVAGNFKRDMFLMEKQVSANEEISYGEEAGHWGILITSQEKLDIPEEDTELPMIDGLPMDVATHDGVPFIIDQIADGQFYLHPGVCGETEVFVNVPDYLKGLYFVQNANIIGLKGVAKRDCYVYILASDNLLEELKAEGFTQVACYGEDELITGNFKRDVFLMEKKVSRKEEISYGEEEGHWGILMTSYEKLNIPEEDTELPMMDGLLMDVTTHDGVPFIIEKMENGKHYLHPGVCTEAEVFQNLPDYLKGLYFVQNANIIGLRGVAKRDCYVYILATENLLEELKAEGFTQVAQYYEGQLTAGNFQMDMFLMEKKVSRKEEISYGEEASHWGILMTSQKKLDIPAKDNEEPKLPYMDGLLGTVSTHAGTPYIITKLQNGECYLHPGVSGEDDKFRNLPEYLQGLYFVQDATLRGVNFTAKRDCYVYILAMEVLVDELEAKGFKMVAEYEEGELIGGLRACKLYLMEKKVARKETLSFGEKEGHWGALITSYNKLNISIPVDYDSYAAVYFCEENNSFYLFNNDQTMQYVEDGVVREGKFAIVTSVMKLSNPYTHIKLTVNNKTNEYDFLYRQFTDEDGLVYRRIRECRVVFDTGEGTHVDEQVLNAANLFQPSKPADPTLKGKTFEGWYTIDGQEYNFDTMQTESVTLYAKWSDVDYRQITTVPSGTIPVGLPYVLGGIAIFAAAVVCGLLIIRRGKKDNGSF